MAADEHEDDVDGDPGEQGFPLAEGHPVLLLLVRRVGASVVGRRRQFDAVVKLLVATIFVRRRRRCHLCLSCQFELVLVCLK